MKLLVLADIHGNHPALEAVIRDAGPVDLVICLGDIAGYLPFINDVIATLSRMPNLVCIRGNHDHVLLNSNLSTNSRSADLAISMQRAVVTDGHRRFLEGLPEKQELEFDGTRLRLFHGTPENPLDGREPFWKSSDLAGGFYLFGHSHVPFFLTNQVKKWTLVNPGSCGFPRDGDWRASYVLIDSSSWQVQFSRVSYPLEDVVQECRRVKLPARFWKSLEAGRWLSDDLAEAERSIRP